MRTIILRAAPGFGKTIYAEQILPIALGLDKKKILIVSSDHYMVNDDGIYEFDWRKLGKNHLTCRKTFLHAMCFRQELEAVIVDNTNTRLIEIAYYQGLGSIFGPVEIHEIIGNLDTLICKNIHGVPDSTVVDMFNRIKDEPIPRFWDVKEVKVIREDEGFTVDGERYNLDGLMLRVADFMYATADGFADYADEPSVQSLVEDAACAFSRSEWELDTNHWVWDMAAQTMECFYEMV